MRKEVIGDATLYLGDCREILPTLSGVDAVVTDPPFGVGFKYASHDDRPEAYETFGGYGAWIWGIMSAAEDACVPGAPIFCWQTSRNLARFHEWFPRDWRVYISAKNFVQMRPTPMQWAYDPIVVWWKAGAKPWAKGTASRDWYLANAAPVVASPNNIEKAHPCPRPLDQVSHIVDQWVPPGAVALDPFVGSGTTGVACIKLGRSFVGVESDPSYFDIACRRIEEAHRQPDMFVQREPERTTPDMFA